MKKIIALILALVLALSLCACGNGDTDDGGSTANDGNAGTNNGGTASNDGNAGTNDDGNAGTDDGGAAAAWPAGNITYLIPNQVGSNTDNGTRIIIDYISRATGVEVIFENNDAGGGAVLAKQLIEAEPDGLTLMVMGAASVGSYYQGNWEFNIAEEGVITPICGHTQRSSLAGSWIITQPGKEYSTFEELVDYVNAHPGEVTAAAAAASTMELKFRQALKVAGIEDKVRWVSTSFSDAVVGLLGGNIDLIIGAEIDCAAYILNGDAVALLSCTTDEYDPSEAHDEGEALELARSVPTLTDVFGDRAQEAHIETRTMIVGPGGMDPELVKQIADVINGIINDAEAMERIPTLGKGSEYRTWSPEELAAYLADLDSKVAGIYGG